MRRASLLLALTPALLLACAAPALAADSRAADARAADARAGDAGAGDAHAGDAHASDTRASGDRSAVPDVIARALQSVVNISVWSSISAAAAPPDKKAAGKSPPKDFRVYGSGLIVSPDGYIVTNRHVIDGAETISAVMPDQTRLPVRVIGVASLVDLALLKVDPVKPLPVLQFGDSDTLRVGQRAFAIGNPLGVGISVTSGIVSALNRNISDTPFDDYVQTDAAINHGNSGGPLLDEEGRVIGLDTMLRAPDGSTGSVGIGFAIPSNDVAYVISRLRGPGPAKPGWIGVRLQDTTPEMGEALGMHNARGAVVTAVVPDGPAAHAGIVPGDIIVRADNQQHTDARSVQRAAAKADIGDTLHLTVWGRGDERDVPVRVALWPSLPQDVAHLDGTTAAEPPGLGIRFATITPALRKKFKLAAAQAGVVVASVDERSDARDRGISPGQVVLQVQRQPVTTEADVHTAVRRARDEHRNFLMLLVQTSTGPYWVPVAMGTARTTVPREPAEPPVGP